MSVPFGHLHGAVSQDVPHFHQRPTFHDHPRRTGVAKSMRRAILDIRLFTGRCERNFDTRDSPSFPTGVGIHEHSRIIGTMLYPVSLKRGKSHFAWTGSSLPALDLDQRYLG